MMLPALSAVYVLEEISVGIFTCSFDFYRMVFRCVFLVRVCSSPFTFFPPPPSLSLSLSLSSVGYADADFKDPYTVG